MNPYTHLITLTYHLDTWTVGTNGTDPRTIGIVIVECDETETVTSYLAYVLLDIANNRHEPVGLFLDLVNAANAVYAVDLMTNRTDTQKGSDR